VLRIFYVSFCAFINLGPEICVERMRKAASLVYVMSEHCLNRFVKVSLVAALVAVNLLSPVSRGGT